MKLRQLSPTEAAARDRITWLDDFEYKGSLPFLTLEEAQALCRRKGIDTVVKYIAYFKSHKKCGLPFAPNSFYEMSWREFFGKPDYLTLEQAQALCKREGIERFAKYDAYRQSHRNIGLPSEPEVVYEISRREFFGKLKPVYPTLRQAQSFCKRKGIDGRPKYIAYRKSHKNCALPATPETFYKISLRAFFGRRKPVYKTLQQTQAFCKQKGIDTQRKYYAYCKSHNNCGLPPSMSLAYNISWRELFGKMSITKEQCIAELKRVAKKLGHAPTLGEFNTHSSFSMSTVRTLFGSWNKGLIVARLEPGRVRARTKEQCIAEIKRTARKLGRVPTRGEFIEHASFSPGTLVRVLGSWNSGLKAAGLEPTKVQGHTKEQCIAEIRSVAQKLGHVPTQTEFVKHASFSTGPVARMFGTFSKGLIASGFEPNVIWGHTKEQCIIELKRVAKKLGRTPRQTELKNASISSVTVEKIFGGSGNGSWNKALVAAGLEPAIVYGRTKEECTAELKRVARKLGHTPTRNEFLKHSSIGVVESLFGTWNKGLIAAGFEPNQNKEPITRQQCIAEIKRIANKLGHTPTQEDFNKRASFCAATVEKWCGTWNTGLKAAGLALNKRLSTQSEISLA
jgi:hypothetical protein